MNRPLTDKAYWDDIFLHGRRKLTYPDLDRNRFHIALARLFSRRIPEHSRVLEVGCGGSLWLPFIMKELRCCVAGIDYSEEGVRKAEKHLRPHGNDYTLHLMDLQDAAPALTRRFDVVYSIGVIEHFEDPAGIVAECKKFLKPGGSLITIIPNTAGLLFFLQRLADRVIYEKHKTIGLRELIGHHRSNGFEILEATPIRFLDFSMVNLHRLSDAWYARLTSLSRLINHPFLQREKAGDFRIPCAALSASLFVVGRSEEPLLREGENDGSA